MRLSLFFILLCVVPVVAMFLLQQHDATEVAQNAVCGLHTPPSPRGIETTTDGGVSTCGGGCCAAFHDPPAPRSVRARDLNSLRREQLAVLGPSDPQADASRTPSLPAIDGLGSGPLPKGV